MITFSELQHLVQLQGTKTNIESLVGSLVEIAFALSTDTHELGIYNGSTWTWVGAGAVSLGDLSDVVIASASSGQVLKYDGSNWINYTLSTSGGSGELLMQDGVTSPPVPLETEDGTDWLYGE